MIKKIVGGLLLLLPCFVLKAQLKLPRLISNGMVLQSEMPLTIWGWADNGSTVKVAFKGHNYKTRATDTNHWEIKLPAQKPGGPYDMQIISGSQKIDLKDIRIGEVWVCSGQSNMEHDLTSVVEQYPKLLAEGNYPDIRQFKVPNYYNFKKTEVDYASGSWKAATHDNIGAFTAVGFFFAQKLHEKTGEAVGLINISLGGSPIEAWLPESILKKYPKEYNELQKFKNDSTVAAVEKNDQQKWATWNHLLNSNDQGLLFGWRSLPVSSPAVVNWPSMSVPGYWADQGLGLLNGVVWLKKSVTIDRAANTQNTARLVLGRMVDADSVFVNGQFIGSTGYQYPRRRYDFPENLLRLGENTITVRLVSQTAKGGFVSDKVYALVRGRDTVSLAGRWKYQVGAFMPTAPGQTFIRWMPGGLYNGMLAPAFSYSTKGFIWYQGESNIDNANTYGTKLKDLLGTVRKGWKNEALPFLVVQLPNFMKQSWNPNANSGWAILREQQRKILSIPNTAMAVTLELGEWNDIHPLNKKPVGERLFLLAEDMCYQGNRSLGLSGRGPKLIPFHHSPVAQRAIANGDTVYIDFGPRQILQVRKGDHRLKHFAIAGADGKYSWAQAGIKGAQVWVYSADVKAPKKVRYGWSDNPIRANLENENGLPASPFEIEVTK
ncbi:sialate O-acetylesterase [Arachidicoccus terrestris]|uniref:sialate O-acetylesterase n=1 Tax=Arachidicoccus terrestris TaxID=2875539 RepID=UPI001CC64E18|nr:sialate O-acetylesterase [Arachidicoccus terrestris]UAY57043.1 sialate O-acetylesterase [Arachidicoccus terrestris]